MAYFVKRGAVARVPVPGKEEQYVEIKAKMSGSDVDQVNGSFLEAKQSDGGKMEMFVKFGHFTTLLLKLNVVGWSLKTDEGEPIPFEPWMLEDRDPDEALWDAVYEEILARNPTLALSRSEKVIATGSED